MKEWTTYRWTTYRRPTSPGDSFHDQTDALPWRAVFEVLMNAIYANKFPVSLLSLPMSLAISTDAMRATQYIPMTHVSPISTGVVCSSRSFPYRHVTTSCAPRPASWTGDCERSCITSTVFSRGIDIWQVY